MPKSSKRSKSHKDRASKKDKSKQPVEDELEDEVPPTVTDTTVESKTTEPKTSESKDTKKKNKSKKTAEPEVAEKVAPPPAVEDGGAENTEGVKRVRRTVTKDSILDDFDQLLKDIDEEVEVLRNGDSKNRKAKGVKFLRSVAKRVRSLKNDSSRVMKTRKQSNRPKNTSSGFMKPVQISQEMANFTGWEPDVPRSRVDVTKYLCQYIRDKNLQNPADRRIIKPDESLSALLNVKSDDKDPLTYYSLQKSIQHHFTNDKATTA